MEDIDERTALLPDSSVPRTDDSNLNENDEYSSSLRRTSSARFPPYHEDYPSSEEPTPSRAIWTVVPISLIGVFVANADGSLVVASSQQIASEFDALSQASWVVTSFGLAQCASQPLYGKLSDIFGRKSNLTIAYALFAAGCFLCGVGQTYGQVIAGRAISGVGGAGMTALVSVIIADMMPVRDVAKWRSYVNVAATTGRALGGPIGGWLCDTIGWRWVFYGQVPLTILGAILILWKMPKRSSKHSTNEEESFLQKLKRVDVIGAISLAGSIISFLLVLDLSAKDVHFAWTISAAVASIVLGGTFAIVEKRWAQEPILPLSLLIKRPAITAYLLCGFQLAAQFATFYSTPLYFQISADVSVANAGLRLVPAVVGNATAGLLSGFIISKTGRYKLLSILSSLIAIAGYTLIFVRWRGSTNVWETLYIFPGGFGSGAMQSTTFIHLAGSLDASDMAIAGTTLYMFQNIFLLVGIQLATTVNLARLRELLDNALDGLENKAEIIRRATSSVKSVRSLPHGVREIVLRSYVDSLSYAFGLSVMFATLGLIVGLTIKEKRL